MTHGFGIDTAFRHAVTRWCDLLAGEAAHTITLLGEADSLLPHALAIDSPSGRVTYDVGDWPADLPRSRTALRRDERVWELFTTEWSFDEIRDYVNASDEADPQAVREAFVRSPWWQEFEEMVALAFAYEWRAALDAIGKRWDAHVFVARPEPDQRALRSYESDLTHAALRFEATSFDARLLYDDVSRVAAFLIHTSEASEAEVEP